MDGSLATLSSGQAVEVEEYWRDLAPGMTVALLCQDDPGVWHEALLVYLSRSRGVPHLDP